MLAETAPTFLNVRWEVEEGERSRVVTVEATLCRAHRNQIWLEQPGARGCGRLGQSCDFCEGRGPRRA